MMTAGARQLLAVVRHRSAAVQCKRVSGGGSMHRDFRSGGVRG
jgi:hypothetical protein